MDDDSLQRGLRARPPADPIYVPRLTTVPAMTAGQQLRRYNPRLLLGFALLLALLLLAAAALVIGTRPSPRPTPFGVFEPTGSMVEARSRHTATLLAEGLVLVTGGLESASAELYDPATGTWTATGSMLHDRYLHTATRLPDGRVLVAGGQAMESDGSGGMGTVALASAEIYDPGTGRWTATGEMSDARYGHTATLLPDGSVLVAGGYGVATAEIFDPRTGVWTATRPMHSSRARHTATLLADDKVLVTGGFGPADALASAELYDPGSGAWTLTGTMEGRRAGHAAMLLSGGQVLVMGGSGSTGSYDPVATAELYDQDTGTWSTTADMAVARIYMAAIGLADGRVLVTGGSDALLVDGATQAARNNPAELYDPVTASWTVADTMGQLRVLHTATLLPDGSVLVAGGQLRPVTNSPVSTAERYLP